MRSKLPKAVVAGLGAGAMLFAAAATARDHHRHHEDDDDHSAAGIVAGVAIAGVIAAIASSRRDRDHEREDRETRRYYDNRWGETFRPNETRNVWCYRSQQRCYRDGHYSSRWTRDQFGYDRRF